jgi:hypothetical protein
MQIGWTADAGIKAAIIVCLQTADVGKAVT